MKKIITLILLTLAGATATFAATPKTAEEVVKVYNDRCPMAVAEGTTLVNVEATDQGLVFNHTVDDALFANLSALGAILHDSLVAELASSPDDETKALIALSKASNTMIIQRFVNSKGKQFDVTILPSEL